MMDCAWLAGWDIWACLWVSDFPRPFKSDSDGGAASVKSQDFWHHSFSIPTMSTHPHPHIPTHRHTHRLNEEWVISHLVAWSSSLRHTFQRNPSFLNDPPPFYFVIRSWGESEEEECTFFPSLILSFLFLLTSVSFLSSQRYDGECLRASQPSWWW